MTERCRGETTGRIGGLTQSLAVGKGEKGAGGGGGWGRSKVSVEGGKVEAGAM